VKRLGKKLAPTSIIRNFDSVVKKPLKSCKTKWHFYSTGIRYNNKGLFGRDYLEIRREVILYFSFSKKLLESANQGRESLPRIRRRGRFHLLSLARSRATQEANPPPSPPPPFPPFLHRAAARAGPLDTTRGVSKEGGGRAPLSSGSGRHPGKLFHVGLGTAAGNGGWAALVQIRSGSVLSSGLVRGWRSTRRPHEWRRWRRLDTGSGR
jgi:hypothetical protein